MEHNGDIVSSEHLIQNPLCDARDCLVEDRLQIAWEVTVRTAQIGIAGVTFAMCIIAGTQVSIAQHPSNPSGNLGPDHPLTRTDLMQATVQPRAFRPKDRFAQSPKVPWAGRRFFVRQPLQPWTGKTCYGVATWSYDADNETLSFDTIGRPFGGGLGLAAYGGQPISGVDVYGHAALVLNCSELNRGSYVAANGFGARTTISRTSEVITLIASEKSGFDFAFRLKSVTMSPANARSVAPHLALEIEGVLADWQEGNALVCGKNHVEPNFNSVYDTTTDVCAYKARITRVAVVDARNNAVVTETLLGAR